MGFSRQGYWNGLPFPSPSFILGRVQKSYLRMGKQESIRNLTLQCLFLKYKTNQTTPPEVLCEANKCVLFHRRKYNSKEEYICIHINVSKCLVVVDSTSFLSVHLVKSCIVTGNVSQECRFWCFLFLFF